MGSEGSPFYSNDKAACSLEQNGFMSEVSTALPLVLCVLFRIQTPHELSCLLLIGY
jgi:hypothetical protein